jgi:hypothetical protein
MEYIVILIIVIVGVVLIQKKRGNEKQSRGTNVGTRKNPPKFNKEVVNRQQAGTVNRKPDENNSLDNYSRIRELKKNGEVEKAIEVALEIVKQTEYESNQSGTGVAPAPYHELAILYRKKGESQKELKILERYFSNPLGRGARKQKLADRYLKLADKMNHSVPPELKDKIRESLDHEKYDEELLAKLLSSSKED